MERQLYIKHLLHVYAASADAYIQDDPVPAGKVLVAHRVAAWFTNCSTSEFVLWYILKDRKYLWLGDDKPGTTGGPCQRDLQTTIGEGMSFGAYSPQITTDEVFEFVITGCLIDLDLWRTSIAD